MSEFSELNKLARERYGDGAYIARKRTGLGPTGKYAILLLEHPVGKPDTRMILMEFKSKEELGLHLREEYLRSPVEPAGMEKLVRLVARYMADNSERESRFLNPDPQWSMKDPAGLLDLLSKETGIDKKTIGDWVDERHLENEQNEQKES